MSKQVQGYDVLQKLQRHYELLNEEFLELENEFLLNKEQFPASFFDLFRMDLDCSSGLIKVLGSIS